MIAAARREDESFDVARSATHDQRCHHMSRCPKNSVFLRPALPSMTLAISAPTATNALETDTNALITPTSMPTTVTQEDGPRAKRDRSCGG